MSVTLINASAGSGKTHRLTHEIAARIREGLRPSELIATTFTRKAAAELQDRVHRTLLEDGQTEAARGIDSALIGTVNAVAGQLVREFALDAGISPEVQELDEERQRAAFAAAIDEAAARAGERAGDLLARTEHDGEEDPALPYLATASWRTPVRQLAEKARTNDLSPATLRESAAAAWEEYRTAALPAPGEDRRGAWLSLFDTALDALRAGIAQGGTGASTLERHLGGLEQLRRDLADPARAPWSGWAKLTRVARGKAGDPEAGGKYAYSKGVDEILLGTSRMVEAELAANPVLQDDVRGLITLVMDTAADSLDAYARYKDELGLMDFIDQEVLALRLLRERPRVREVIAARVRLLAVDEFQDTSPVQLALFLELAGLVEDLIWVGDPKQAIYGFREADPELMRGILDLVTGGGTALGEAVAEDLRESWRSQEPVLDLVGAVFPAVFPELPREQVVLEAAPGAVARRAAAGRAPGRVEVWTPRYSGRRSQGAHAEALAEGVAALLAEDGSDPADVAVLVRSNAQARRVAEALAARGVPASGQGIGLLDSREGRLVRAALAVTLDLSDTLALTELVDLLPDHAAHVGWFAQLAAAPDAVARQQVFTDWWQDATLRGLHALRAAAVLLTPGEMITALIDALDLPERIRGWSVPEQRLRTLDALRALAAEYTEQTRSAGAPVTLPGLRAALDATDRGPELDGLPGTVWVGTVHGAKGLEWSRVVVMLESAVKDRAHTSGVMVVPAPQLDVLDPLAGRSLRYWPAVLGGFPPVQEALAATTHAERRSRQEREESGRLQYVALTRARDVTVLSGDGTAPVLDALVGGEEPLLRWSPGEDLLHLAGGTALPVRSRGLPTDPADPDDTARPRYAAGRSALVASDLTGPRPEVAAGPGARMQASGVASAAELGTVAEPRTIGPALVSGGGKGWDRVGEAVHAYLALPLAELTPALRQRAAERLVDRWAVRRAVGPQALLRAGEAWMGFLAAELPGAEQVTEQPIAWWNEDGQTMEGWIDALLRRPDGSTVLVDHKTYPGEDPAAHVREHHLGQLATYADALAAAGQRPDRVLVHLPLRGEVVEVHLHQVEPHADDAEPRPAPMTRGDRSAPPPSAAAVTAEARAGTIPGLEVPDA